MAWYDNYDPNKYSTNEERMTALQRLQNEAIAKEKLLNPTIDPSRTQGQQITGVTGTNKKGWDAVSAWMGGGAMKGEDAYGRDPMKNYSEKTGYAPPTWSAGSKPWEANVSQINSTFAPVGSQGGNTMQDYVRSFGSRKQSRPNIVAPARNKAMNSYIQGSVY